MGISDKKKIDNDALNYIAGGSYGNPPERMEQQDATKWGELEQKLSTFEKKYDFDYSSSDLSKLTMPQKEASEFQNVMTEFSQLEQKYNKS